ncbi:hypothetical protein AO269_31155 [Pseudomonas putida]|nr:hypothetical protein AO269_31155 [Pseudomonas putida]
MLVANTPFDVGQALIGLVLDLQKAYMWSGQSGAEQAFEHCGIVSDHTVLGRGGELVGYQLARVVEFLAQVLQTHEGKEANQQQRQQQRRPDANDLGARMNVAVQAQLHVRARGNGKMANTTGPDSS